MAGHCQVGSCSQWLQQAGGDHLHFTKLTGPLLEAARQYYFTLNLPTTALDERRRCWSLMCCRHALKFGLHYKRPCFSEVP